MNGWTVMYIVECSTYAGSYFIAAAVLKIYISLGIVLFIITIQFKILILINFIVDSLMI